MEIIVVLSVVAALGWLFAGRKGAQVTIGIAIALVVLGLVTFIGYAEYLEQRDKAHRQECHSRNGTTFPTYFGSDRTSTSEPDVHDCYYPLATSVPIPHRLADPNPPPFGNAWVSGFTPVWFTPHESNERVTTIEDENWHNDYGTPIYENQGRALVLLKLGRYYKVLTRDKKVGWILQSTARLDDGVRIYTENEVRAVVVANAEKKRRQQINDELDAEAVAEEKQDAKVAAECRKHPLVCRITK